MTVRNAGATTADVRLLVEQVTTGIWAINLQRLDINAAGTSYGIYADGGTTGGVDRVAPDFTLADSKIKGHTNNGVGLDAWRGKSTIADNDLYEGTTGRGAILVMNEYTTSRMPDPVIVKDNTSVGRLVYVKNYVGPTFGGYDDIQVTGNVINDLAGGTGTDCNTAAGPDCGILVSSNSTTYTAPSGEMSDTVYVTLDREEFPAAAPSGGAAIAAYGDAVVTGEPVPISITVEDAADPGDGDDDGDGGSGDGDDDGDGSSDDDAALPDTGGPASATPLNLAMALMSILVGSALITAGRKRKPGSIHSLI